MTFEQLCQSAQGCLACDLANNRTNVVFGMGNPASPLVLVGEGPGEEEDKQGLPFVGRSGKMLDRALADNGLDRTMVYITNTVKCRAADFSGPRPMNRQPTEEETLACRQWLVPQLAMIRPKVILCIGAPSAKNLIKKNFKITQERGQYFPCEFAKTALATLHPSYIMRQAASTGTDGGYGLLVQDIAKAWGAAQKLIAGAAVREMPEPVPSPADAEPQASLFE